MTVQRSKRIYFVCAVIIALVLAMLCTGGDPEPCLSSSSRISLKTEKRVILAIGDSNGVVNGGWPTQLALICHHDTVINNSESGRTIGFDNCGKESWNALKNIKQYLSGALKSSNGKPVDEVVIMLGTNDTKACFADRQDMIVKNLVRIIHIIYGFANGDSAAPHITIVTPPPYAAENSSPAKAKGAHIRVRKLGPRFRDVALNMGCGLVDMHKVIEPVFGRVAVDRVHLSVEGHAIAARAIADVINDRDKPLPPINVRLIGKELTWKAPAGSDVLGYEIVMQGKVIKCTSSNRACFPRLSEKAGVRTRDLYGNVSRVVQPDL